MKRKYTQTITNGQLLQWAELDKEIDEKKADREMDQALIMIVGLVLLICAGTMTMGGC